MARRKKRPAYINPKAPKDQGSGDRKKFRVMPHASLHIKDEDGVTRKYSGRQAELDAGPEGEPPEPVYVYLTEEMATFYANLGYIEVELDFATEKDAEIVQLHAENQRLNAEVGDADALRRRIAELEAQLAGSGDLHSEEQDSSDDAAISAAITSGADSETDPDAAEDGSGDYADSGGTEPSSGTGSGSVPKAGNKVPRRRRKAS